MAFSSDAYKEQLEKNADFWKYSESEAEALVEKLKLVENGTVVDYACGPAQNLANHFEKKYKTCQLIGVDISQNMVEYGKEKYPQFKFIHGDLSTVETELGKGSIDVLISTFALCYMGDDYMKIFHQVHKLLKTQGQMGLVICLGSVNGVLATVLETEKWKQFDVQRGGSEGRAAKWSWKNDLDFTEALSKAGFKVVEHSRTEANFKFDSVKELADFYSSAVDPEAFEMIPDDRKSEFLSDVVEYLLNNSITASGVTDKTVFSGYCITVVAEKV